MSTPNCHVPREDTLRWRDHAPAERDLSADSARLVEAEALLGRVDMAFVVTGAGYHTRTETSLSAVLRDVRAFLATTRHGEGA